MPKNSSNRLRRLTWRVASTVMLTTEGARRAAAATTGVKRGLFCESGVSVGFRAVGSHDSDAKAGRTVRSSAPDVTASDGIMTEPVGAGVPVSVLSRPPPSVENGRRPSASPAGNATSVSRRGTATRARTAGMLLWFQSGLETIRSLSVGKGHSPGTPGGRFQPSPYLTPVRYSPSGGAGRGGDAFPWPDRRLWSSPSARVPIAISIRTATT